MALERFVPAEVFEPMETELDAALASGTLTHREVMNREFAELRAPLDEVVAYLLVEARVRPGFADFVRRFDPLILSASFHETIEPVLAREGVTARVHANRAHPGPEGWRIEWLSDSECATCGEACKRGSLPDGPVVYVGDGYSDRCAALAADRVFARDHLARYLEKHEIPYEPFGDFGALAARLG
jgi:2-hydroxy-3-keto-5-methylthiopentenyl-1-phosphate phosphatase